MVRALRQFFLDLLFAFWNFLLLGLLLVLLSHGLELQKCYPLQRSYMHEDIDKYRECTRDDMNDRVQCMHVYILIPNKMAR